MSDPKLRDHLGKFLDGRQAHVSVHEVLDTFPFELLGRKPAGAPHTPWELFEHMRIAQWDILEFSRDADHVSPDFPKGYWPEANAPKDRDQWQEQRAVFKKELAEMRRWIEGGSDLFLQIPHGTGQTLLREALLIADHNAYHLGQMVLLRKMMEANESAEPVAE